MLVNGNYSDVARTRMRLTMLATLGLLSIGGIDNEEKEVE